MEQLASFTAVQGEHLAHVDLYRSLEEDYVVVARVPHLDYRRDSTVKRYRDACIHFLRCVEVAVLWAGEVDD